MAPALASPRVGASYHGQVIVLADNAEIPAAMRGYVQLALDRELLQAYPAEIRQIGPGQFVAVPGPRFEPARQVKRGEFVPAMVKLVVSMFGE